MILAMAIVLAASQIQNSPPTKDQDCSQADTVKLTPGETLQRLDDFKASLAAVDRLRLDRALPRDADGGIAQCDAVEGRRASCEAAAYMPALRTTRLMPRFLASICSKL